MEHILETFLFSPGSTIPLLVGPDTTITRIDAFLKKSFPSCSRTFFQKLIDQRCIQVNNKILQKASVPLKIGDSIIIIIPETPSLGAPKACPDTIKVEVIFEHPHFLIINKPAGLMVHKPSATHEAYTLVDWLLTHFNEIKELEIPERPGIVHRLDKDTSGLMIIARNRYAQTLLSDMFKNRLIKKTYKAVVAGKPNPTGTITFAIGRDPFVPIRMSHRSLKGRHATTHYVVEKYFNSAALVDLKPITGRTHQLRVHCAALGHPIIGDHVYGASSSLIGRQALHAAELSFIFEDTPYYFHAPVPEDFQYLLSCLPEQSSP